MRLFAPAGTIRVEIRPARHSEIDAVSMLLHAEYASYEETFPWPRLWSAYHADVADVADRWGDGLVLVAEIDGAMVGSIHCYPPGRGHRLRDELVGLIGPANAARMTFPEAWGSVRYLVTRSEHRRCGIGRALVERAVEINHRARSTHVGLHTLPTMHAAIALHERMGFLRLRERDLQIDPGSPDRVLAYVLSLA